MTPQRESPPRPATGNGLENTLQRDYIAPRRLAPYARHVTERQRAGIEPNVYIFAGSDCWNLAEHRRRTHGDGSTLVLPPGEPPESFRWPALDALCLIPGDAEGDLVRRLVVCLLCAGCRCVMELRPGKPPVAHKGTQLPAGRWRNV